MFLIGVLFLKIMSPSAYTLPPERQLFFAIFQVSSSLWGFFFLIVLIHNQIHYPEMQRKVVWKKMWVVTGYLTMLKIYLGQNDSIMVMFLFFLFNRVLIFYRYIPKYLWIRWFYFGDFLGFSSKWSSFRGGGINQTRASVSCITIAEHS